MTPRNYFMLRFILKRNISIKIIKFNIRITISSMRLHITTKRAHIKHRKYRNTRRKTCGNWKFIVLKATYKQILCSTFDKHQSVDINIIQS